MARHTRELLRKLYRDMLRIRTFESSLPDLYNRGQLPRVTHLYVGQEAVAVGTCSALKKGDYVTGTHRSHGHLIALGGEYKRMTAELGGRITGYCKGKGGTMHIADIDLGMIGAISIVGAGIPIAVGAALAQQKKKTGAVVACFFGDGAVNNGTFGEGLNMAAIWKLPVVFVCENNFFAISADIRHMCATDNLSVRAQGYGMPAVTVDGNDVLAVYDAAKEAVGRARRGEGPSFVECRTYRWFGHSTGDPGKVYRKETEIEEWKERCPIARLRQVLLEKKVATAEELAAMQDEISADFAAAVDFALNSDPPSPDELTEDVYGPPYIPPPPPSDGQTQEMTYAEALNLALIEEMRRDPDVFVMGEDVGIYGGNFKVTKGLIDEFGPDRVIDTPISENGYAGAAIGAAIVGMRPVAEIMFTDLMALTMDQVVNLGAKIRYMTGGRVSVPAVIRAPSGGGVSAAATHSQSLEAWFCHVPGLKVVMPSTPEDARGLLKTAIREDNLVIFFEHKRLYNTKGPVTIGEMAIPFGVAAVRREGTNVTVVATSFHVLVALKAAEKLAEEGISVEVIDPRTLWPLDLQTIANSVKKTGRLIVVEEAVRDGSAGADIAASVVEAAFDYLDAPPRRLGAPRCPIPLAPALEAIIFPTEDDVVRAAREIVGVTVA